MKIERAMLTMTLKPSELERGRFLRELERELGSRGARVVPRWSQELIAGLRARAETPGQRAAVEALRTVHHVLPANEEHAEVLSAALARESGAGGALVDVHFAPRSASPSHVAALQPSSIVTPEFLGEHQLHLDPAPSGINARYAWQFQGAGGDGVHMYIMEGGWSRLHPEIAALPLYDLDQASAEQALHGNLPLATVNEVPADGSANVLDHGAQVLSLLFAPDRRPAVSFSEVGFDGNSFSGGVNGLVPFVAKIAIGTQHDASQPEVGGNAVPRAIAAAIHSARSNPTVLLVEREIVGANKAGLGSAWNTVIKDAPGAVPFDSTFASYLDFICAVQFGVHVIMPMANGGDQTLDGTRFALDKVYDALAAQYRAQFNLDPAPFQPIRVAGAWRLGNEWKYNDPVTNSGSNYAHHTDCFGPLPAVTTDRSAITTFLQTSAASAMVAGVAASILGRARALHKKLSPSELRKILRDTKNGQAVKDALFDQVVPNMARIFRSEFNDRAPDLFFKKETPKTRWSPDIIIHPVPLLAGAAPAANEMNTLYGDNGHEDELVGPKLIRAGDKFAISARVRNRGPIAAHGALVRIFSAPPSPINPQDRWRYVGSAWIDEVKAGKAVISPPVVWTAEQDGHASFVAEVTCGGDNPQPDRTTVSTWGDLVSLALKNENLAFRSAAFIPVTLADKFWTGEGLLSVFGLFSAQTPLSLEVESNVPKGSTISVLAPNHFLVPGGAEQWITLDLDQGRAPLVDRSFVGTEQYELRFRVQIPVEAAKNEYSLALLQKREGLEVGRAAVILLDPRV